MLDDLYKETIIDHSKKPRNNTFPEEVNCLGRVHNQLCGDQVEVGLVLNMGLIDGIGFEARGCAISIAAASLMTEAVKGRSEADALFLLDHYSRMVHGEDYNPDVLGKLAILSGISQYPTRWTCALLGWEALQLAIKERQA